jgi:hypothetical protein
MISIEIAQPRDLVCYPRWQAAPEEEALKIAAGRLSFRSRSADKFRLQDEQDHPRHRMFAQLDDAFAMPSHTWEKKYRGIQVRPGIKSNLISYVTQLARQARASR